MEPITRKEVFLNAMCADKPCGLEPVSREEILLKRLVEAEANEGGGSGLPAGSKPNQYIVTDGEGKVGWEDKLCWSESSEEVVLPECQPEIKENTTPISFKLPDTFDCVPGESYVVNWNGTDYKTVAVSIADTPANKMVGLGNLGEQDSDYENTGEPFAIILQKSEDWGTIYTAIPYDSSTTLTISIRHVVETIHKLSGKYVEGMGWSETAEAPVLAEQSVTLMEDLSGVYVVGIDTPAFKRVRDGDIYKVVLDGIKYTCKVQSYTDFVPDVGETVVFGMGNLSFVGGEDSGEPFFLNLGNGYCALVMNEGTEHTISIAKDVEVTHPIDKKYLPTVCWDTYNEVLFADLANPSERMTVEQAKSLAVPCAVKLCDRGSYIGVDATIVFKVVVASNEVVLYWINVFEEEGLVYEILPITVRDYGGDA